MRVRRWPPLTVATVLVYALAALTFSAAAIHYAPGRNPQWVLALLAFVAAGVVLYVAMRGRWFTVDEATVLLALYLVCIARMAHTTHLDLGALADGLAMPLIGVYVGWLLPRRASIVYYAGLLAWFVTLWSRGNHAVSTVAVVLVAEAVAMTEVVRFLSGRVTRLMETDPLTGLFNRGAILRRAEHEVEISRRHQRPLSVAVIDLDDLRLVNNTDGHAAGDELLKRAAGEWLRGFAVDGVVGRIGGDEFLAVFPGADAARSEELTKAVRASSTAQWTSGIAQLGTDETLADLVERADQLMYAGKAARKPLL